MKKVLILILMVFLMAENGFTIDDPWDPVTKKGTPKVDELTFLPSQQSCFNKLILNDCASYTGAFGSGKTLFGSHCSLQFGCKTKWWDNSGNTILVVRETYPQLMATTLLTFRKHIRREMVADWSKSEKVLTLKNGTMYFFRHGNKVTDFGSFECGFIWLDEGEDVKEEIYLMCVGRQRLKVDLRRLLITSNPGDMEESWVWQYFFDPLTRKESHDGIKGIRSDENIHLPKDYILHMSKTYEGKYKERYYEGEFNVIKAGRVYYAYDDLRSGQEKPHVPWLPGEVESDPNMPLCILCDFNVNPCCWSLWQHKVYENGDFNIHGIDELEEYSASPEIMCEGVDNWLRKYPHYGLIFYGDATGEHQYFGQPHPIWTVLRKRYPFAEFRVPAGNPSVIKSILIANECLKHVTLSPKCTGVRRDFLRVRYKEGKQQTIDKISKLDLTHFSDGFRYFCAYERDIDEEEGQWSQTLAYDRR